jgi:hypothetical protein
MVEIELDPSAVRKLINTVGFIKDGVPKVLLPAMNRTLNHGRTVLSRAIREDYTIKAKDIPVRVKYPNLSRLAGSVYIQQGMLGLEKFKHTPKDPPKHPRMVHAEVRIGRGGNIPHAFVAKMPNGFVGIFTRVGKARLPIKRRLAIGASIMASQPHVRTKTGLAMRDMLIKRVNHEVDRVLQRAQTIRR